MTRRNIVAATLAVVVALVCLRLGLWQLERHEQRRTHNERVAARMAAAPTPLERVQDDSTARYRRVEARGVFDYDREIVLANRTQGGSPGVHVITPLLLTGGGGERAILVNRGWVYSADAARVELDRWREADTVEVSGYLEQLGSPAGAPVPAEVAPRIWYRLDPTALAAVFPYGLETTQLVAREVQPNAGAAPVRVGMPGLEQGPHLSYAFQWFAFGAIALIGVTALIRQDVRRRS